MNPRMACKTCLRGPPYRFVQLPTVNMISLALLLPPHRFTRQSLRSPFPTLLILWPIRPPLLPPARPPLLGTVPMLPALHGLAHLRHQVRPLTARKPSSLTRREHTPSL